MQRGALLGVRNLQAIRRDLASALIPMFAQGILHGLADEDDDMRAVAAEALYPVAGGLVTIVPDKIPELVENLWDALLDLGDISASGGAVMRLLSKLTKVPVPKGYLPMWLDRKAVHTQPADPMERESNEFKTGRYPDGHVFRRTCSRCVTIFASQFGIRSTGGNRVVEIIFGACISHHFLVRIRPLCSGTLERIFRNILLQLDPGALRTSKKCVVYAVGKAW